MTTASLVDDEHEDGLSPRRAAAAATNSLGPVNHLETAEELTAAMAARSQIDALNYRNDWLERRDHFADGLSTDDLVTALELLAAELRSEGRKVPNQHSPGLEVAARSSPTRLKTSGLAPDLPTKAT